LTVSGFRSNFSCLWRFNVDWNYIQALFIQGFGPQQISDKTGVNPGTIRSRAVRLKWYDLRAKVQLPVAYPNPKSLEAADSKTLALESQRTQARLSRVVANQVTALESHEPVTYRDLRNTPKREGYAATANRVIQQAAKLYGWTRARDENCAHVRARASIESRTWPAPPIPERIPMLQFT